MHFQEGILLCNNDWLFFAIFLPQPLKYYIKDVHHHDWFIPVNFITKIINTMGNFSVL